MSTLHQPKSLEVVLQRYFTVYTCNSCVLIPLLNPFVFDVFTKLSDKDRNKAELLVTAKTEEKHMHTGMPGISLLSLASYKSS